MQKMVLWGFPRKPPLFFHDPLPCFAHLWMCTSPSNARKIMQTSNQPLRLQGEEVCNAKNALLWLPRKIHYCFANVLLTRACSTYNHNTPGAPKIISSSFSLISEEIVTAQKDLGQHRSKPEKTEVAPWTRKENHLEIRGE